jgi:paraquat-inducible protein A
MIRERKHSAAVILLFCCVGYPVIKLGILSFFWMFPFPATWRASSIALLHLLSRWSMIDVLAMTAIVLASMTIGPLQATPKPGLYFYALGIVLLTFTAMLMSRIAGARR